MAQRVVSQKLKKGRLTETPPTHAIGEVSPSSSPVTLTKLRIVSQCSSRKEAGLYLKVKYHSSSYPPRLSSFIHALRFAFGFTMVTFFFKRRQDIVPGQSNFSTNECISSDGERTILDQSTRQVTFTDDAFYSKDLIDRSVDGDAIVSADESGLMTEVTRYARELTRKATSHNTTDMSPNVAVILTQEELECLSKDTDACTPELKEAYDSAKYILMEPREETSS